MRKETMNTSQTTSRRPTAAEGTTQRGLARGIGRAVRFVFPGRTPSARRSAGLCVEQLEQRDVPTAVNVTALANALVGQIRADARQLVRDTTVIEIVRPTPARTQILGDLVALNNDAARGSVTAIFTDATKLVSDAVAEAQAVNRAHSSWTPLLRYTAALNDVIHLARDQVAVNQLINYVVQQQRLTSQSSVVANLQSIQQSHATSAHLDMLGAEYDAMYGSGSGWADSFDSSTG
jgi:hypothetical protein